MVLFGGTDGTTLLDDTWEWDGAAWSHVTTATHPTARRDAAMAFDVSTGLTTLYGGTDGSGVVGDTWLYNGGDWYPFPSPAADPGARTLAAMIYSPEGDALVLYGGTGPGADASTWRFSGGTWYADPSGIGPRVNHAMAYDHFNDHAIVFGGRASTGVTSGLDDTRQWCSPCPKVSALLDSLGNVIEPDSADPDDWADEEPQATAEQDTRIDHPESTLGNDLWPDDSPCDFSLGGEPDSTVFEDPWPEEADSLGIPDMTEQEFSDSITTWEARAATIDTLNADEFPDSLMRVRTYTPPVVRHCLDRTKKYAFGGRDIVFVHGLRTTPLKDRMWSLNSSWVDWVPPDGKAGYVDNPAYYEDNQYWKDGANKYWQKHIERFLHDRGYANRYLIVAWPATQHLKYGMSAILSQISDAMIEGKGVVDPSGHDDKNAFGYPGYVIVSHSTGGPVVSAMLGVAHNSYVHAQYIADHAKAHVAIEGAFSGSRIATVSCWISALLTAEGSVSVPMCKLLNALWPGQVGVCDDIRHFDTYLRGITWDLQPLVMQARWGPKFGTGVTPTVTIVGGHPSFQWPAKYLLLSGLDDGVLASNSASANPNVIGTWPSGYFRVGPTYVATMKVYDYGIRSGSKTRRARGYYMDQIKRGLVGTVVGTPTSLFVSRIASGCTDTYSPTGMIQPHHFTIGAFKTSARYPLHMSFIECASDHFGMTPGYDEAFEANNEYRRTTGVLGAERNAEEVRVTTDPAISTSYTVASDPAPLIDTSNPAVVSGLSTVESTASRCAKRKKGVCKRYRWERHYVRLSDWQNQMATDYAYAYLLTKTYPDTCYLSVGVDAPASVFYARNEQNPFTHDLAIGFRLPERGRVDVEIYDPLGRRVRSLGARTYEAGAHTLMWDGRADSGGSVQPGLYFWRMRLDGRTVANRKALLVR